MSVGCNGVAYFTGAFASRYQFLIHRQRLFKSFAVAGGENNNISLRQQGCHFPRAGDWPAGFSTIPIPALDKAGWREAPGWFDAVIPPPGADSYITRFDRSCAQWMSSVKTARVGGSGNGALINRYQPQLKAIRHLPSIILTFRQWVGTEWPNSGRQRLGASWA